MAERLHHHLVTVEPSAHCYALVLAEPPVPFCADGLQLFAEEVPYEVAVVRLFRVAVMFHNLFFY